MLPLPVDEALLAMVLLLLLLRDLAAAPLARSVVFLINDIFLLGLEMYLGVTGILGELLPLVLPLVLVKLLKLALLLLLLKVGLLVASGSVFVDDVDGFSCACCCCCC